MKTRISIIVATAFTIAILADPARAQDNFTSSGSNTGGVYDYSDPANWSSGVPNLNDTTNTAVIGDGNNVGYYGASLGDLIISGTATLEITSGTFTQVSGNNYIQLGESGGGGGNFVINGGVFNQAGASSTEFNITGVGNSFSISSGTANFDYQMNITQAPSVMSWTQSGGLITISGTSPVGGNNELDINSNGVLAMSGGQFILTDLMNIQGGTNGTINFSGGTFTDLDTNPSYGGWYGPNSNDFNFTVASTGTLQFVANSIDTLSAVQGWVNAGDISYNDTADSGTFNVTEVSGTIDVDLIQSVPEPSTCALVGFGSLGIWFFVRRKKTHILP